MIAELDYMGNGKLNYSEFLSATLSYQKFLTDELLWKVFKKFDIEDTETVTIQDLIVVFKRLGRLEVTEDEIKHAIDIHDSSRDYKLQFDEFKRIFFEDFVEDPNQTSNTLKDDHEFMRYPGQPISSNNQSKTGDRDGPQIN